MDCRHGHALFVIPNFNGEVRVRPFDIFVLDPVTGRQRSVPSPYSHAECFSAAVFCAAQGCDHHDCQGGHFFVAVVSTDPFRSVTSGWLYSSETRIWSRLTPVEHHPNVKCENHIAAPSVLVGDAIYFNVDHIIKCQLGTLQLSAFEKPTDEHGTLMAAEDGGLGFAAAVDRTDLTLWSRVTEPGGAMGWTKIRVVDLKILLPDPFSIRENKHECGIRSRLELVSGLAEGTQIIFLSTCFGSYIVDLKSGRATVSS
uniref:Uncharacterized protein n=2 Tax=Avena sativa TaxID=4498 RepID=A0ACD5XDD1_AVESA